ncbi:MAG: hypothetical protein P4L31_03785 [Candidatus Babeliales bacterium]|nr:hypothetical protein [Candidatus Babeliales bacterium]
MKRSIFFIVLLYAAQIWADPLLVVVLMVKDEASVIEQTLQPFVDGGVSDFVIFDTGSTDGTQEVVADFFKQHGISSAHIVQEAFIDFATSRNHALQSVEKLFPQATFMLMPDAEWYMHNTQGLLAFCAQHEDDFQNSYLVPIKSTALSFFVARLIRCKRGVGFVGRVHEVPNHVSTATLPDDVFFEWRPAQKGQEKTAERWKRDRDILLKHHQEEPADARTLFYLAQTYDCLGDWENAYTFYKKRLAINGWDEENFMAQFRLGNVALNLMKKNDKELCSDAIKQYLKAFSLRPQRAEPLIKIAQYYLDRNEMHLAYVFAARAAQIPYPTKDVLFVEKYMYDFTRYDILGRCAWYVKEYEVGRNAILKALEVEPNAPHLKRNLAFYTNCRN